LTSTAVIANTLARSIVAENDVNKVLVFTEEVEQVQRICKYCVWGQQKEDINNTLLEQFNESTIRAIGSCNTLGVGVNLIGATHMIVTDYLGSSVKLKQRIGRMHRLDPNATANIYIIRTNGTQCEKWFREATRDINIDNAIYLESSQFLKP
jgi:superfamily II DNA or RNA helicase